MSDTGLHAGDGPAQLLRSRRKREGVVSGRATTGDMTLSKPTSLSSLAKESLRARIITGELQADRIYSVPSLAAAFQVSATPVREAMVELVSDGLVEVVPNQGFRVVQPSEQDLDEIFQVRLMLEVPGMLEVARRGLTPAELARYVKMAQDIERYAKNGDHVSFVQTDRAFHLGLLASLGNRRLVDILGGLRDQARLYGLPFLSEKGQLDDSAREHSDLVAAVGRSDLDGVARIYRHHLEHTRGIWANKKEASS